MTIHPYHKVIKIEGDFHHYYYFIRFFENNLIYFQHGGCKWLLCFHIQHHKINQKHNWSIIDNHNKMKHSQYKC